MPENKSAGFRGPAIAIGIIVFATLVYQFWFVPKPPTPSTPAAPKSVDVRVPPIKPTPEAPSGPVPNPDVPAALVWSTYHGGTDLAGFTNVSFPDRPDIAWQYIAEGEIRQPAVADERGIYVATTRGDVIALDFQGHERWKKKLMRGDAPERIDAPVACFNSSVVVGSKSGLLHALSADNGETRWTFDVGGEVLGSINFHAPDDTAKPALLFAIERGQGVLHGINFETGADVWHTDPIARTDGSMAVSNGTVIYGSCDFALHVYGAAEGLRINTIALCGDCQVASGPAFVGDDIYSGSRAGHFYRANAKTGAVVWTNRDSTKEIFTTPAIAKDSVVFGSEDGGVYCLDRATGKQKWRFASNGLPSSPVIASDKVIVGIDGELCSLKLDSGEKIWGHEVSDGIASPSIINGMVVAASEDGTVVAFGEKK